MIHRPKLFLEPDVLPVKFTAGVHLDHSFTIADYAKSIVSKNARRDPPIALDHGDISFTGKVICDVRS